MTIAEERATRTATLHTKRKALIEKVKALTSEGLSNHDIAEKLGIKESTVLICKKQA